MGLLISIDTGHYKCGLLLADTVENNVLEGRVVKSTSVIDLIKEWHVNKNIEKIILGNGTTSKFWQSKLIENNYKNLYFVEEKGTTLRARDRYWELWPPRNFIRFFPKGILFPPQNLDALAAMILLEDYLEKSFNWDQKPSFKIWPE